MTKDKKAMIIIDIFLGLMALVGVAGVVTLVLMVFSLPPGPVFIAAFIVGFLFSL